MSPIANNILLLVVALTVCNTESLYAANFLYSYPSSYAIGYSYGNPSNILPLTYSWEIKHHHPDHKEDTSQKDKNTDTTTDNFAHKSLAMTTSKLDRNSFSNPILLVVPTPLTWKNSAQYHVQDKFGQYMYGYINPESSKHELRTLDGTTKGLYSYTDSNGELQTVKYISDEAGFRVAATNLPKTPVPVVIPDSPEIALAKAQHFQAQKEALDRLNAANINE